MVWGLTFGSCYFQFPRYCFPCTGFIARRTFLCRILLTNVEKRVAGLQSTSNIMGEANFHSQLCKTYEITTTRSFRNPLQVHTISQYSSRNNNPILAKVLDPRDRTQRMCILWTESSQTRSGNCRRHPKNVSTRTRTGPGVRGLST